MYTLSDIKIWMPKKANAPSTRKQKVVVLSKDLSKVLETFYINMKYGSYTGESVKLLEKKFGVRTNLFGVLVVGANLTDVQFRNELKDACELAFKDPEEEYMPKLMSSLKFDLILKCKTKEL